MRIADHRRVALVAMVAWNLGCPGPSPAPQEPTEVLLSGSGTARVRVQLNPLAITIMDGEQVVLQSFTSVGDGAESYGGAGATQDACEDIPSFIPGWDGYVAHELPWQTATAARIVSQTETRTEVEAELLHGKLRWVVEVDGQRVKLGHHTVQSAETRNLDLYNKTALPFVLAADEHFFGLGERYATYDHKGWSLYSWAEEAGTGAGENVAPGPSNPGPNGVSMTYFPVPLFHSSAGYTMHVNTTSRSELHFGSERTDAWRVAVNGPEFDLTVYVARPVEALDLYTQDTGRPPEPAPWVWGPRRRMGRGMVNGTLEWQLMRDLRMPITAADDATHFLPASSQVGREQQLSAWADTMHANGFKVIGYYNPYVSHSDPGGAADYAYGREHGLFVKGPDGEPALTFFISGNGQEIAAIDLSNPEAVTWFQSILQRSLDIGYDGWMHDFGEYVRRDSTFFNGKTGEEMHNLFPVLSAKAAFEYLEEHRPNDYLYFVRSGYAGTQAYTPAVWSGDPEASFDDTQGLPAMARGGLSLALSGVPYWGSDAQGYKCINTGVDRNKELFLRWLQFSAVSPIMMDQNRCFNLLGESPKWTLWSDADTPMQYARWSSLHTRLQPYFMTLARVAHQTGMPMMRPPVLLWPERTETFTQDDVFFLGPALFVAPVLVRNQFTKRTWLPPGTYTDLEDHKVYAGDTMADIPAPVEKMPILLVTGQVLPLLDATVQTLAPATQPGNTVTAQDVADRLDVVVALAPGMTADLTLTDGTVLHAQRVAQDVGNADNLTLAATEADLQDCARCYLVDTPGDVTRYRLNTNNAVVDETVHYGDVEVRATGIQARRYRFEILRVAQ